MNDTNTNMYLSIMMAPPLSYKNLDVVAGIIHVQVRMELMVLVLMMSTPTITVLIYGNDKHAK